MTPIRSPRESLEHTVEDEGGQGLGGRSRDRHVVDRTEVLVAPMEVRWYREPVDEVVGVEQIPGPADVQDDGDSGLLRPGPDAEQVGVAGRARGRATGRHEERRRAVGQGLLGSLDGPHRVGKGHVAGREQAPVDGAELEHAPVVGAGGGVGQVEVAAVLEVVQAPVVEGVEQQLTSEAQEVERPGPVLGDERAGRGEVLPCHDLGVLDSPVLGGGMALPQPVEGDQEIRLLLLGAPGLAQLVAAGVGQDGQGVTEAGLGVVPEPGGGLHDVCVGVVDDPSCGVRHGLHPSCFSTRDRRVPLLPICPPSGPRAPGRGRAGVNVTQRVASIHGSAQGNGPVAMVIPALRPGSHLRPAAVGTYTSTLISIRGGPLTPALAMASFRSGSAAKA